MLDVVQVSPIIDYIIHEKFGGGNHPTFSMKGRTANSIIRGMEEWHNRLQKEKIHKQFNWDHTKISDFEFTEGTNPKNLKTWTITELLNTKELSAEGKAMNHCVYSYTGSCSRRITSIWSLKCNTERKVTIEVSLRNIANPRVCQVRGKCNRMIKPDEQKIIRRWVTKERLEYL